MTAFTAAFDVLDRIWAEVRRLEDQHHAPMPGPIPGDLDELDDLLATIAARAVHGDLGACADCMAGDHRRGEHSVPVPGGGAQCPCPCNRPGRR